MRATGFRRAGGQIATSGGLESYQLYTSLSEELLELVKQGRILAFRACGLYRPRSLPSEYSRGVWNAGAAGVEFAMNAGDPEPVGSEAEGAVS